MSTKALTYSGLERLVRDVKNNVGLLDMPKGEILHLSAGGCTTASIAKEGGVVDISGNGNHGQALNGVQIVKDNVMGDCFSFSSATYYMRLLINQNTLRNKINTSTEFTMHIRVKYNGGASYSNSYGRIGGFSDDNNLLGFITLNPEGSSCSFTDRINTSSEPKSIITSVDDVLAWNTYTVTVNYITGLATIYLNGEQAAQDNNWFTGTKQDVLYFFIGYGSIHGRLYGLVSDVRIYPYALSASQVKSLYVLSKQPPALLSSNRIIETTDRTSAQINTLVGQVFA